MYNYQDATGRYLSAVFFVSLVMTCALLFMNIIVAILFDNYEDHDEEGKQEEMDELEKKALSLGIPQNVCEIIIKNDIIIEARAKTSKIRALKSYCRSLCKWDDELNIKDTRYFRNGFIKFMFRLVNHPIFQLCIFIAIALNTLTLSLDIYNLKDGAIEISALEYFNYIFF